jgi:hypothetical protein
MNIFEQLAAPFPPDAVHWRVGATNAKKLGCKPWEATKGIALAYIDARDVMQRLDEVVGPENWQCRYPLASGSLLICEIGIFVNNDKTQGWIWKANGAGETDVEADKGKCSDSFKRAAVLWGIGQYLYDLDTAWCDLKNGKIVNPPRMPGGKPEAQKARSKDATKEQRTYLETIDQKLIPKRWMVWLDKDENWNDMSFTEAESIINETKENEA